MRIKCVKFILLLALSISFVFSCDLINPEEKIPSYISVDTFLLNTIVSSQGPSNHNITDVWVSVNGSFIGTFEIPAHFPVLVNGDASIYIKAGIKKNGIAASRDSYPFYDSFEMDTVLIPGQTLSLTPIIKYSEDIVIDWFENFEDPGISIDTNYISMVSINDSTVNGSKVALVKLTDEGYLFRAETLSKFNFPLGNTTLYLEMDYKSNNSFIIGLMITSLDQILEQPVISINPIDYWNKIYIDLSHLSSVNNYADNYSVFIRAAKADSINAVIMFDNFKLIHF